MTPEQQRDAIAERLKQLETQAALESAVPGRSAQQLLNEAAVAEFDDYERTFTEARWGIRARMTGGPIVVTTVSADTEAARNNVQVPALCDARPQAPVTLKARLLASRLATSFALSTGLMRRPTARPPSPFCGLAVQPPFPSSASAEVMRP